MSAFYNDPKFSYLNYWTTRQYEHQSELMVLRRLLGKQHFDSIVDLGGGYGRLIPYLTTHNPQHITLVEPALKQRQFAKHFLSSFPNVNIQAGSVEQPGLPPTSADLIVLIRVAHHISDLTSMFNNIHTILKPNGLLVLEFANSLNFKSRLRSFFLGQTIPRSPIDMRTPQNQNEHTIAFLNHHPRMVLKTLHLCHFEPLRLVSVSNFRSPFLKKIFPLSVLLVLENLAQHLFSSFMFGPSIFVLARRIDKPQAP